MVAFAAAAIFTGLQLVSSGGARGKRRKARKLQRRIQAISNVQRKRVFLNRFRQAQADTLSAGVASGAGLESSGVRATLASQETQKNIATAEFEDQQRASQRAGSLLETAESLQFASGLFGTVGGIAGQKKTGGGKPPGGGGFP